MITSKINGVTKHQFGGENFIYYFSVAIVTVSGDEIQYLYFNNEVPFRFSFSQLTQKYDTLNAEGFVDYLANNNFFVDNVNSVSVVLDPIIGDGGLDSDYEIGAMNELRNHTILLQEILFFI